MTNKPTNDLAVLFGESLDRLRDGFADLPACDDRIDPERLRPVLHRLAERLQDNYPYHHPLYCGQMLKPPHPVAHLAYALTQWINPNNHALDGGRATSAMEKEVVAELAGLFGWREHLGHLAGGGTMANLEALWIAGRLRPGTTVLASEQAHYTHERLCGVLGLDFEKVPADRSGRMDVDALRRRLQGGGVGAVVGTAGTTALGAVDPIAAIADACGEHDVRLHVDAAYGGYFRLVETLAAETRRHLAAVGRADSIVVDPHKHGLQPYGCGCVLFRDPEVGRFYRHDSPYTYFTSSELHLGEISLECSRPGASAAALRATMDLLPLEPGGEFARDLAAGHRAAVAFHDYLERTAGWRVLMRPELDIVVWAVDAGSPAAASEAATAIFRAAAERDLHLAVTRMPAEMAAAHGLPGSEGAVTCLRACLMKPAHEAWLPEIIDRLEASASSL